MAVGSQQYTVTTTAVLIASAPPTTGSPGFGQVGSVVVNNTGATVYLGGSNVSATNGLAVATSATTYFTIALFPGDNIYAICATSSVVSVLQT